MAREGVDTPRRSARVVSVAEGLLLILTGDELQNKDRFQKLDKTYIAEIIFGVESDTHDILGIIKNTKKTDVDDMLIRTNIERMHGNIEIELPHFSSYKVRGKPLFWWARQKRINEIEIPKRTITIFSSKLISLKKLSGEEIKTRVAKKTKTVHGDFRQQDILNSWDTFDTTKKYVVAKIEFNCSSGTYIRSLATIMGKKTKTGALLFSLTRTRIGTYTLSDCKK